MTPASGLSPSAQPKEGLRLAIAVVAAGLLLAWTAFHIWDGHDEMWGHGGAEFGGLFPRQPLIGILAVSLCIATALGYLLAAVALILRASWSGAIIVALAVPGAIGGLYSFVFGAANTWAIGFPSGPRRRRRPRRPG